MRIWHKDLIPVLPREQVAIILQAIEYYRYHNQYITQEQWDIADTIIEKIEDLI